MGSLHDLVLPRALTTLVVAHNRIQGNVEKLRFPPNLQHVNLSDNAILGSVERMHLLPQSLQSIVAHENEIEGDLSCLPLPQRLVELDLGENALSGVLSQVTFPQTLVYLDLSDNLMSGSIEGELSRVSERSVKSHSVLRSPETSLRVSGQEKRTRDYGRGAAASSRGSQETLVLPSRLQHADLRGNELVGRVEAMAPLPAKLDYLDLSDNLLTGDGKLFQQRQRITHGSIQMLDLRENQITDATFFSSSQSVVPGHPERLAPSTPQRWRLGSSLPRESPRR